MMEHAVSVQVVTRQLAQLPACFVRLCELPVGVMEGGTFLEVLCSDTTARECETVQVIMRWRAHSEQPHGAHFGLKLLHDLCVCVCVWCMLRVSIASSVWM